MGTDILLWTSFTQHQCPLMPSINPTIHITPSPSDLNI